MTSKRDRTIDYIEFTCPNMQAAKAFYERVFGWTFTDYGPDYTSFADGRLAGGFRSGGEPSTGSGALVVIFVDDLAETVQRVKGAGGTITQEIFAFPGGSRFQFRDPAGNELAAWHEN